MHGACEGVMVLVRGCMTLRSGDYCCVGFEGFPWGDVLSASLPLAPRPPSPSSQHPRVLWCWQKRPGGLGVGPFPAGALDLPGCC